MPALERTVVLIKPDAVQRGMIGEVIHRFERKGLQLVAMKMMVLTDAIVAKHYEHHLDKPFFASLKDFMQSSPIIAMVWQGPQAIGVVRTLVGPTKGHEAAPGTIRGDFTIEPSHNAVHASDSTETAAAEIERFFEPAELIEYERTVAQHLYEPSR
jgi:nucleoside-diphosphate kinase